MIATESCSVSSANHRFLRWCHLAFASNRLRQRRFGPFRASEGLDSRLLEINQPLQVVAGCHHRHRKVRPRLADGAQQLAAHLLDGPEHMLDLRASWRCACCVAAVTRTSACSSGPCVGFGCGSCSKWLQWVGADVHLQRKEWQLCGSQLPPRLRQG